MADLIANVSDYDKKLFHNFLDVLEGELMSYKMLFCTKFVSTEVLQIKSQGICSSIVFTAQLFHSENFSDRVFSISQVFLAIPVISHDFDKFLVFYNEVLFLIKSYKADLSVENLSQIV